MNGEAEDGDRVPEVGRRKQVYTQLYRWRTAFIDSPAARIRDVVVFTQRCVSDARGKECWI